MLYQVSVKSNPVTRNCITFKPVYAYIVSNSPKASLHPFIRLERTVVAYVFQESVLHE